MIGPILITQPSDLWSLSSRVQGDVTFVLSPDLEISNVAADIVNLVWVRTWLYPLSRIDIQSSFQTYDFFALQYQNGTLGFNSTVDLADALLSRYWTPTITAVPTLVIGSSFLPEVRNHFPGLQEVNVEGA